MRIKVNVNDVMLEAEVEPRLLLVHFIRETLGLTAVSYTHLTLPTKRIV